MFILLPFASLQAINLDSLQMQIKCMPADSMRLVFLSQNLVGVSMAPHEQHARAFLLLDEAKKQNNTHYKAVAMLALLQYHYMESSVDSMTYWLDQSGPLFQKEGMIQELCRTRAWYIYRLTKAGMSDEALHQVKELKKLAGSLSFPDGLDMANQALADFYLSNALQMEGVKLYEEVLAGMEQRNVPLIKRINILRQLSRVHPDTKYRLKYLARLKQYLDEADSAGMKEFNKETPVYYIKYIYHRGMVVVYSELNDFSRMYSHLNAIQNIVQTNDLDIGNELLELWAIYYRKVGDYAQCLNTYDSILKKIELKNRSKDYLMVLSNKSDVLFEMGNYKASAEARKVYIHLKDSITEATYYKDLVNMRAQHETDKLELKNKKMEMEAMRTHAQLIFLWSGIGVLMLICVLLAFLAYTVHRFGKQLKVSKEKAEESDRLKSAFLANMNHEIRTPLNAIVGFSQVLVDENDRETRGQIAEIIQSNNDLLQRLIEDVLDLSKIESNSMTLRSAPVDLTVLMKEIYSVIHLRMHHDIELRLDECQPFILDTDRNRLTQIITNLLNNAIKHTKEGYIRFGYHMEEKQIVFFVQDTGVGIPEDKLDSIFSRFVKLDDWTKGVGLGLAICQGLVMKMKGTIRVESQVGKGSVFYVLLPLE